MLDTLLPGFLEPYATAPTTNAEARTGYDVKIVGLKTALFQFKRSGPASGGWDYYLNPMQYWTFRAYCGSRKRGFYVLPTISSEVDLQSALMTGDFFNRVAYLDVFDVPPWTDGVEFNGANWIAHGFPGAPLNYYSWDQIKLGLERCTFGVLHWKREAGQEDFVLTQEGRSILARLRQFQSLARLFNSLIRRQPRTVPSDSLEDVVDGMLSLSGVEGDEDRGRAKRWVLRVMFNEFERRRRMGLANWGLYSARNFVLPMRAVKDR